MIAQHRSTTRQRVSGFTLVELAIVLVIMGLLVGGVLAGQSLVRAAQLNAVGTEYQRYLLASVSFLNTYNALPGDMKNATSYWGNATTGLSGGDCTAPESDAGTAKQTCNGNGDGLIAGTGSAALNNSEVFRYWQHLGNAGLIENTYSGVASDTPVGGSGWRVSVPGQNQPMSRFNKGGWFMAWSSLATNGIPWVGGDSAIARNWLWLGAATPGDLSWASFFSPAELFNVDTKFDDGMPGTGIVRNSNSNACVTSSNMATSIYNLAVTSAACTLEVDTNL